MGHANVELHPDVEPGRLGTWLVLHGRLHSWGWSSWGEVVFVDPCGEWFGEECVVAAGVVEVLSGVDECGGAWGVSVGPAWR